MRNPDANCKCYGKIAVKQGFGYNGKPELGMLSLETDEVGEWLIVTNSNSKTIKRLMIADLQYDKLSPHFIKDCTVGKFALDFNSTKIEFIADSSDPTASTAECRTTFGATLLNFKSPNNYGNKVHDLSLPNLSSTMPPATSPFPIKKTEIKAPFSANGNLNLSKRSPHKINRIRRPYYRKPGEKLRNFQWGTTAENDLSGINDNGMMDSDEENNVQVNSENRLPNKKATCNDDNFHRRKSIPCHVQSTTPPYSKMPKGKFYGSNSQDSNRRFSTLSKLSNFTPPSKRQSLLSIDSAPKKSKLEVEIDNKENEGERQNLPIGFPNLGNTCYLNAGLRATYAAITSCSSGEAAFMSAVRKMNKDHFGQNFCQLLSLSKKLQSENLCDSIKDTLFSLKSEFQKHFTRFIGNEQQDAHEFLSELLSSIGTDLGTNIIKGDSSNMSISDYFFQYTTKRIKKCTNCTAETAIDETHRDCPVNVMKDPNERNIQSSLALAFKNTSSEGKCEKCQFSGCTFSSKIFQLPRILMVYIIRYGCSVGNAAKTCDTLKAPKYITLDPFCDQNAALSILPEEYKNFDETSLNGYSGSVNAHYGSVNGYSNGLNGHSFAPDSMNNGNDDDKSDLVNEKKSDIVNEKNSDVNDIQFLENVELEDEEEAIERAKRLSLEYQVIPVITNDDNEVNADESQEDIKISEELRDNFLTGALPHSYRLISCVRHNGVSTNGGHYVSYSYDVKRKKFFYFNDSHVSEIPEESFYSSVSGGYIFMYLNNDVCLDNIYRCSAINK